jgi:hypothetical protein
MVESPLKGLKGGKRHQNSILCQIFGVGEQYSHTQGYREHTGKYSNRDSSKRKEVQPEKPDISLG